MIAGNFIKVKEPEASGIKKKTTGVTKGKSQSQTRKTSLNGYFTGKGHVLGHPTSCSEGILVHNLNLRKFGNSTSGSAMKLESGENSCIKNGVNAQKIVPTCKEDTAVIRRNNSELLVKENVLNVGRSAGDGNNEPVDSDIIFCVSCPACNSYVSENTINSHLDLCLTQNS